MPAEPDKQAGTRRRRFPWARPGGRILDGPIPGGPHPGQVLPEPPARRRVVVVVVDGSPDSGEALRQAASQARQRNALLDIVHVAPAGTEGAACILARVKLGEFTRRECPYGTGVPVRLRVECGDPLVVLGLAAAEAELLINGLLKPPARAASRRRRPPSRPRRGTGAGPAR